ncbi:MAG: redox-sensing transcriptional repressor Rex [Acidimicrobiia bacterium]|nr:MAG: redox-sensing transcriptional repressor Rex [Acidimicrobiia bacterium]
MKDSIPEATVARLPRYLHCLSEMAEAEPKCSSEQIADAAGVNGAQVRKDFSYLGSYGTRGVGYDITDLKNQIRKVLGLTRTYPVVVVGAGNLGSALANYKGFDSWGFDVVAVVDIDAEKIGRPVDGLKVESMNNLVDIVKERGIEIGIIATPASAAQSVANRLAEAGLTSILNLAPTILQAPDKAFVRRVDLTTELGILAYHRNT